MSRIGSRDTRPELTVRRLLRAALAALAPLLACHPGDVSPPPGEATLAIDGVSVIPMGGERVLTGMAVLVGGGRVLAVRASADADIPDSAVRVEGRDRFLIPGLNDMHVHFREKQALGRFLATGVTGVRILSGGPHTLDFRDRVPRGELLGPDIHTAGASIEDCRPRNSRPSSTPRGA
ncbi:amidohydrolase family protein [Candidatus Palauibacter sp.]|uniref:amidohydrolase family protein n=1 Tax=Candidatus Palauibacter sp. TaxID=3101350 RepID=UPI003CC6D31D